MISDSCVLRDQIGNSPRGRWGAQIICDIKGRKAGGERPEPRLPRTYHHKVTVPRPHSSCQLSRLRSNHVRLHRARTPRRPSLPLNPSAAPLHLALAEVPSPQHTFQATATSINFFTRALRPPTPRSLSPSLRVRDPRRRPRASSNREKARFAMAVRFLGWRLVTGSS